MLIVASAKYMLTILMKRRFRGLVRCREPAAMVGSWHRIDFGPAEGLEVFAEDETGTFPPLPK